MRLGMTIGERIRIAYELPTTGSLKMMDFTRRMRAVLIGFAASQLESWGITTDETTGQYVTSLPNTGTQVTIADDLVLTWSELINEKSIQGGISLQDAQIFQSVTTEAERLIAEQEAQTAIGETLTAVDKAHRAANLCNAVADAAIEKAEELGYEPEEPNGE